MKLTPFAKLFITLVVLGVIGFVAFTLYGDQIKQWAGAQTGGGGGEGVVKDDFKGIADAPPDPGRNANVNVSGAEISKGKLTRPLVVGINTWAGHAPGIVFNNGMEPNGGSQYKQQYGMDVKLVLLEDPSAKLAAFRSGQVDIVWNTKIGRASCRGRVGPG